MKTDSFDFTAVVEHQDNADWIDIDTMAQSPTRVESDHFGGDISSKLQVEINSKSGVLDDIGQKLQFELTTDWA